MNDIRNTLFGVYGRILKDGYIFIDETMVNWNSRHKLLPIKLMLPDFVQTAMQEDENGVMKLAEKYFIETPLLCLTYNNSFTIWETLIRKGLLEGTIEITNN